MDKLYRYIKDVVVSFKLDTCFCVAPIRSGLLCIGYFNIFISLLFLVGTADEAFKPPLASVQAQFNDDEFSKPLAIVAYAIEMAFNMLLLCGIHRNDKILLRVYIYFGIVSIVSSILVYSIVFAGITLFMQFCIIWILVFQCYVIILVRSLIVEMKEASSEKNGHVTLYSVVHMPDDIPAKEPAHPIEITVEPKPEPSLKEIKEEVKEDDKVTQHEQKLDEPPANLETINEHKDKDNDKM